MTTPVSSRAGEFDAIVEHSWQRALASVGDLNGVAGAVLVSKALGRGVGRKVEFRDVERWPRIGDHAVHEEPNVSERSGLKPKDIRGIELNGLVGKRRIDVDGRVSRCPNGKEITKGVRVRPGRLDVDRTIRLAREIGRGMRMNREGATSPSGVAVVLPDTRANEDGSTADDDREGGM